MVVKASTTVTITAYRDTKSVTRYYKLVSATASAPTIAQTVKPSEISGLGWTDTEPTYTSDSTNILYFFDASVFSDDTWLYSEVSKSSSYEAAKQAYNKAQSASDTASAAQTSIDNLEIGGKNILLRTKDFSSEKWYIGGISTPVLDDDGFYYCGILNTWNNYIYQIALLELNEVYTCSFYAKADSAVQLEIKDDGTNNRVLKYIPITSTEWQRYTCTFTKYVNESTTSRVSFLTRQANTTIYIKKIKLEKGNKATDWTPAPEDMTSKDELVSTNESIRQDVENNYYSHTELGQSLSFNETDGLIIQVPNSPYETRISNTQIEFRYQGQPVAYINGEILVIPKSMMLDEMMVGNNKWSWRIRDNGNLQLKWIG